MAPPRRAPRSMTKLEPAEMNVDPGRPKPAEPADPQRSLRPLYSYSHDSSSPSGLEQDSYAMRRGCLRQGCCFMCALLLGWMECCPHRATQIRTFRSVGTKQELRNEANVNMGKVWRISGHGLEAILEPWRKHETKPMVVCTEYAGYIRLGSRVTAPWATDETKPMANWVDHAVYTESSNGT